MKILNALVMLIGWLFFLSGLQGAGPTLRHDSALTIAGAIVFAGGTIGLSLGALSSSIGKNDKDK